MIAIKIKIAHSWGEMPEKGNILQEFTGNEDDAGRNQPSQKLSHHQHIAANRSQKIVVQAAVENFSAKQIHEDP